MTDISATEVGHLAPARHDDAAAEGAPAGWRVALRVSPLCLFLCTFLGGAVVSLFLMSFWTVSGFDIVTRWTLGNYGRMEPYLHLLWRTIWMALLITAVTLLLAYPLAYALAFRFRRWRGPLLLLILITIFTGYLVKVYAWMSILGQNGIVNRGLQLLGLIDHPISFLLFSSFSVVVTLSNALIPFALLPILSSLQNIPYSLIEASRDMGASGLATFRRVTLPLSRPGIVGAFGIAFILAGGDYITPQLVGGPSGQLIGQTIAGQFGVGFDWPLGSAMAFSVLGAELLVFFAFVRVTKLVLR